jgi:hypothetical protein
MTTTLETTYNGYANYETWNVALWIQNDEGLYNLALQCDDYQEFVKEIGVGYSTPDGVKYASPKLDIEELNEVIADL